jgi:hypothetical protein
VHATAGSVKGLLWQTKYERCKETCSLDIFVRLMTQGTVKVNAVCVCAINESTSKDEKKVHKSYCAEVIFKYRKHRPAALSTTEVITASLK